MKKISALCLVVAAAVSGCSTYASVAATADGKALVAKNGFLGKDIYVCQITPAGLTACQSQEAP